jgi:ArsR family transcriptional regulator
MDLRPLNPPCQQKRYKILDNRSPEGYIPKSEFTGWFFMKDFIKIMKALSDPNRIKIVKMLQHKTMCVCEMQEALQVSQPTVSKNLKILEDAGLVDFKKDGLWVDYHLTDGAKSPYVASLLGNLRHWLENEVEVIELIEKIPHIRREEVCRK